MNQNTEDEIIVGAYNPLTGEVACVINQILLNGDRRVCNLVHDWNSQTLEGFIPVGMDVESWRSLGQMTRQERVDAYLEQKAMRENAELNNVPG
jgi:hypothetical protein